MELNLPFALMAVYGEGSESVLNGVIISFGKLCGGPGEIRTPDLLNANQALSQLSYRPARPFIILNPLQFAKHMPRRIPTSCFS